MWWKGRSWNSGNTFNRCAQESPEWLLHTSITKYRSNDPRIQEITGSTPEEGGPQCRWRRACITQECPKGERCTNQRAQSNESRHCINETWEDNIIKGWVEFKWKGDRCIEADKSESCIESCHRQKGYVSFICLHLRIIITFILVTATATKRNMSKLQPIATSEAGSSSSTTLWRYTVTYTMIQWT